MPGVCGFRQAVHQRRRLRRQAGGVVGNDRVARTRAPHPGRELQLRPAETDAVYRVVGVQAPQLPWDRVEVGDDLISGHVDVVGQMLDKHPVAAAGQDLCAAAERVLSGCGSPAVVFGCGCGWAWSGFVRLGRVVGRTSLPVGVETNESEYNAYDPSRCVRCDAAMLDEDVAPRRGRRRLYRSDTCRRDASAARTAAERYGAPIRVIEVPRVAASQERSAVNLGPDGPVVPMDTANRVLADSEALRTLLARLAEQARLKKLDRATLTAARDLSNAVHPHRDW